MNLGLTHKNALVCGSTQGIGKASAKQLAELGANVTLVARNEEKLQHVLTELATDQGQSHTYIVADFQNPESLQQKISATEQAFHILVNNTGGPAGGPVFNASLEEFEHAFTQHLKCNHILAQTVVPGMKKEGYGRIINIISTSVKQPLNGLGVSNTIRGAVANWSKTLANELGVFGITVNNVLPGATATERLNEIINNKATKLGKSIEEASDAMKNEVPAKRFAKPQEIAYAIAFLASEAASYINGINLPVDGGRTKSL
ncbi:3-oxoacyl-[acyl-carrier protein] reductase [Aquimarina sp. EL_43]|uniref:SDR family oxidoreductase n=1 Tax=unclassified Aquimarina TaxID=2627091 RepID=UPI0018CB6CEA|nr:MULTISPECIES: SDR family oxidoreductase [unclassified Aquimarina]MBG6128567.1 3-oxoacyl-[acyl-carrier protein] reductase [Aquimarina sp. EL_35]MBG6149630.1 3-oxoacyl-[acyl-carrier protein] reductase [Aquimarina sp. EL_32]MBG6167685.1 3-oxoacyl-[acyl-carrier protein] reductase [Aquimarina sp. EL_43]